MRIFTICLLTVGAFAADTTKERSGNKHAKRGLLTDDHATKVHKGDEQFAQQYERHAQSEYQHPAQSVPSSTYISDLAFHAGSLPLEQQPQQQQTYPPDIYDRAGSLPLEHQRQTYPTGVYDNVLGQIVLRQVERGYDHSAGSQKRQNIGEGMYAYSDVVRAAGQSIGTNVQSNLVNVPASVSHSIPLTKIAEVPRTESAQVKRPLEVPARSLEPVYATRTYQMNVNRSLPVPVTQSLTVQYQAPVLSNVQHTASIRESLDVATRYVDSIGHDRHVVIDDGLSYGQRSIEGQAVNFYGIPANLEGLEVYADTGYLGGYERVNVGSQQYDFRGQAIYSGVSGLDNGFPNVYKTFVHQEHLEQPAQVTTSVIDNKSSGYHYDKPTKKFTF